MAGMNEIAKAAGVHPDLVTQVFDAVARLVAEDHVVVKNFGTFRVRETPARAVVSPQLPGGRVEVPERRVLRFRQAPTMKDMLNGSSAKSKGTPGRPKKKTEQKMTARQEDKAQKGSTRARPKAAAPVPSDEELAQMTHTEESEE